MIYANCVMGGEGLKKKENFGEEPWGRSCLGYLKQNLEQVF